MVKGTIVDTTPSDEILKKNKEVESVCSRCVENVKVKTLSTSVVSMKGMTNSVSKHKNYKRNYQRSFKT